MIIFPTGINITNSEYSCLLHMENDVEGWLLKTILEKARLRKEALINEWRPRLFADPNVTKLPANEDTFVELILSQPDYRNRAQSDAELTPPELPYRHNIARFNGQVGTGTRRNSNLAAVTLFATGIDISDRDAAYILAYVQDLEDWVLGALLGHINRGRKKMIRQYTTVLMEDPEVTIFPANEDDLIQVIIQRDDYKTLPMQVAENIAV